MLGVWLSFRRHRGRLSLVREPKIGMGPGYSRLKPLLQHGASPGRFSKHSYIL